MVWREKVGKGNGREVRSPRLTPHRKMPTPVPHAGDSPVHGNVQSTRYKNHTKTYTQKHSSNTKVRSSNPKDGRKRNRNENQEK